MATPRSNAETGIGVIGIGAAACAACCAGPILGFLAAIGIVSILGTVVFGLVGVVVVLAVAAVLYHRRRRQQRCAGADTGSVSVEAPMLTSRR
jgi:ethanolamine transporter EutH